MPAYLFNIQISVETYAKNEEEAYELLMPRDDDNNRIIDQDVMLVDVYESDEEAELRHQNECIDADRPCDSCLTRNLPVFDGE